jgi:hypothetical protein
MPRVSGKVRPPSAKTLARYGIDLAEWRAILRRQGGVCAVCRRVSEKGWMCIDHEHAPGWKRMPPEQRRRYVRGILCYFCNFRYVGKCLTAEKARAVAAYLEAYEDRKGKEGVKL